MTITPTYSGCPAMATMRDDLVHRLTDAGYAAPRGGLAQPGLVERLDHRARPGRRCATHGLSAPGPAPRSGGPIPLTLMPTARAVTCPQCGSTRTELTSEYGATACKALYRCSDCLEPFEHVKEISMAVAAFHPLTVAAVEELDRRRGRGDLRGARTTWPTSSSSCPASR